MFPSREEIRAHHAYRYGGQRPGCVEPAAAWAAWSAFLAAAAFALLALATTRAAGCWGGDLLAPLDSVAAVAPYVIGTTRGWYVRFRPVHRFHDLRTPRRFRVEAADVVDGGKVSTGRLMAGGGYYVHRVFVPHGPTEGDSGAAIAAAEEIRYRVEGRVL